MKAFRINTCDDFAQNSRGVSQHLTLICFFTVFLIIGPSIVDSSDKNNPPNLQKLKNIDQYTVDTYCRRIQYLSRNNDYGKKGWLADLWWCSDQGHAESTSYLAQSFFMGWGTRSTFLSRKKDRKQSCLLIKLAAEQGHPNSMKMMTDPSASFLARCSPEGIFGKRY